MLAIRIVTAMVNLPKKYHCYSLCVYEVCALHV